MDEKNTSKWIVAATCSSLVLIMAVGAAFALRDQLMASARADNTKQTTEREKLAARINDIASKLNEVAATSKPDTAPLDALGMQVTATNAKLNELSKRLDALEKAAAEKKAEPMPAPTATIAAPDATSLLHALVLSGKPYATELAEWQKTHPNAAEDAASLAPFAEKGLPSESTLIDRLRDTLDAIPTSKDADAGGLVSRINTHLDGLVKIKKTDADPYAALRKHALSENYTSLLHEVEQLPETQRTPLASWLQTAHKRAAAVATLDGRRP